MARKNDQVEVYKAADGWRWRRKADNGRILADSGEAYENFNWAAEIAAEVNVGIPVFTIASN